jgi:hypothetical protein
MKNNKSVAAAVLLGALAMPVHAYIVTADPSEFAYGTNLSDTFDGIRLETWQTQRGEPGDFLPFIKSDVYSTLCSPCATAVEGDTVFGRADDSVYRNTVFFYSVDIGRQLRADSRVGGNSTALVTLFDEGTNYIEIVAGGASNGDFLLVEFWDTEGNYVGRCASIDFENPDPTGLDNSAGCKREAHGLTTPLNAYTKDKWTMTWHDENVKIGMITAGGWGGSQHVFSMTYAAPEPAAIAPLAVGLLGLGLAGFRRRRAAL